MSRDLITFRCPQCQAALSLPASMAGAEGPCLYCETEIIGPNPAIGQPARLATTATPATPTPPEPPAAPFTEKPAAPVPPAPLEPLVPLEPLEIREPVAASAFPFPLQSSGRQPQSSGPQPQSAPAASVNLTASAATPARSFTDVAAPPAQTATAARPAEAITPAQPQSGQPAQPAQPAHPFPRPESAPPRPESAPWDPFAQQAAPANPIPPQEQEPAEPFPTRESQATNDAPPFSFSDVAPPAPAPAPREAAFPLPTNRFSAESSAGASPPASLPPLSRQGNPLSPTPEEDHQQHLQPHHQPQPQRPEPFGQPQAPQPTDPFAQHHQQTQPPFPGGGYQGGSDIPPPPTADQRPWQDVRLSNLPKLPKLPGGEALRGLIENLRTSPLAPLAIAGTLVILLIVFGIYLFRDYKEIVPNVATGTSATGPAPATTPAVDPATTPIAPTPAVDPVATTTPDTTPAPPTPDPTPATSTAPNAAIDPATAATTPLPPAIAPNIDAPGGSLLDGPIATLQAFVSAATWQERLDHSLYPEVVKPLMEIYYRNYPDEAVVPESTRFQHSETDPETGKRFFVFHVTTVDAPDGFPVLIEETSDGLRVDWETFVEFKDNLFQRFATNPSPGKLGAFHLIMRNAHYFGEEFPELKGLTPYRLDPPIPNQETYAFALTDSVVNKDLQEQVTWGMNFTPFLELRWAKSQNGTDYLQVVSVLHTNWRNRTP